MLAHFKLEKKRFNYMADCEAKENELWVADFTCSEARNGIVEITINNLDTLHDIRRNKNNNQYVLYIYCEFVKTFEELSNPHYVDHINISAHNQTYVTFPMHLYPYDVNISITGIYQLNEFGPKSETKVIHIPSFLSRDDLKIGERVRIWHTTTNKMIKGQIMNILNDNMYQINYTNNNEDEIMINLPISSIYPKTTDLRYTYRWPNINKFNEHLFNMNLLCYRYHIDYDEDDNKYNMVNALHDFFVWDILFGDAEVTWLEDYSQCDSVWKHYMETLYNFLIKNICDFMFEVEYEYDIYCMMDTQYSHSHRKLKFENVQKYYLGQDKLIWTIAYCDCCGYSLTEFDYGYFCHGKNEIQHQICVDCISTMIDSWEYLEPLLCKLLNNELNNDCIETIVEYVVGRINYVQYVDDNSIDIDQKSVVEKNNINQKRKLINNNGVCDNEPPPKKQKLDD
eukprot:478110_1